MTRKEVCQATGLSVKTLRLYEEKGLIAPARQRRNGREYREYTPELVRELEQIVVLRRALFTMDEIKTMREHPELLPGIFDRYHQWLAAQEEQFHLLRQTADRIDSATLSSVSSLLSELRDAASTMPLPAMDVKPNFKRLDEMEEGPRHVEAQVNLDEMIPSPKVFRQVNLMMDRDKVNDVGVAFGHFNALRDSLKTPEASGPVQRTHTAPKWRRRLGGALTVLCVLGLVLALALRAWALWAVLGVLLAFRVGLSAVPLWKEHQDWLEQAHADQGVLEAARRRRRRLLGLCLAGVILLSGVSWLLAKLIYWEDHPATDYRVLLYAPLQVDSRDLDAMEDLLSPLVGDRDGNGKALTVVDFSRISPNVSVLPGGAKSYSTDSFYEKKLKEGEYALCFITNFSYGPYNISDDFEFYKYCQMLPEDMTGEPEANSDRYRVDLGGAAVFDGTVLEGQPVYGCVAKSATQEEYDLAVELLRLLLEDSP